MIGVNIPEDYEKKLRRSLEDLRQQKQLNKIKRENRFKDETDFDNDENFEVIIGYTSGGMPYGITHDEWEL